MSRFHHRQVAHQLLCQRCREKDATHSLLGSILLCRSCFEATFLTQGTLDLHVRHYLYLNQQLSPSNGAK